MKARTFHRILFKYVILICAFSSSVSKSSPSRLNYSSSRSSSSASYYARSPRTSSDKYRYYRRSHSSSTDHLNENYKHKSRGSSKCSSVVIISSSSPSYKNFDSDTTESIKLIREIKRDFKLSELSETSLFAELMKDKNKRELVLKNLATMEKKKQDLDTSQCGDLSNNQNLVVSSNGMCVTDIIKEIPLPPPIPSSFSSFLSSAALPKTESVNSSNRPVAIIDLTETENLNKTAKEFLVNDVPECIGSSITSNSKEGPISLYG